jgi:23S rRNA (guanine745-N1)-methyltransferase
MDFCFIKIKMINLLCTVRNCQKTLKNLGKILVCPSNHSFDISRNGYINLLQPQDKRSLNPGDSEVTVLARHRLLINGQDSLIVKTLVEQIKNFSLPKEAKILDVGCGEGFYLNSIINNFSFLASGLDISTAAIKLAAKSSKKITWVIANADRFLPYPDKEFDIVMSITARKNPSEFKRVLLPQGYLLIVVPAQDDLIELREAIMGKGVLNDPSENIMELFSKDFNFLSSNKVEYKESLNRELLTDVLLTTYRGARHREQERFEQIEKMTLTFSRQIFCFSPK